MHAGNSAARRRFLCNGDRAESADRLSLRGL